MLKPKAEMPDEEQLNCWKSNAESGPDQKYRHFWLKNSTAPFFNLKNTKNSTESVEFLGFWRESTF